MVQTEEPSIDTQLSTRSFRRLLAVSKMENTSSKFRLKESQCICTGGEGFHSINVLFLKYNFEVAATASLLLAFITAGYIFWKRLENVFSYKQWRYSKQVSLFCGKLRE